MLGVQRRVAPVNRYIGDLVRDSYVGRLRSVRLHVSMNYFQARLPKSLYWTAPPENFSSIGSTRSIRRATRTTPRSAERGIQKRVAGRS